MIKSVSFKDAFVSSMFSFLIIFIWWCSRVISFVCSEWSCTSPQLISEDLMEHVRGRIISAVERNVQFFKIISFLWGQVSIISNCPSKAK